MSDTPTSGETTADAAPSVFLPDIMSGNVVFVTGGATGIGKEIAREFGRHGARVAIASRKQDNLEAAKAELEADGIECHIDVFDVRDAEAARRVIDGVIERYGRLDVVVNNAAGNFPAPITSISPNGFKSVVDIDLLGTYNVSRAAFDAWLKDHGRRMTLESAMAKLYASETAVRAAEDCVQLHGGYGFVKDYPAEKFFRDVKLLTIGEGTSEVQRLVIARQLLGHGIQVFDVAVRIRRHDGVADRLQRDLRALFLVEQRAFGGLALGDVGDRALEIQGPAVARGDEP